MKKIMVWLLSLTLMMTVIAGCSNEQDNSNNTGATTGDAANANETSDTNTTKGELVFWTPFGGGDYEFMKEMVDEYNSTSPEYTVEIVSKAWDTYYQGINGALISQSGPDVFITHQSKLAELIPTQQLQNIQEINSSIDWNEYNESQLAGVTVDDVQYAVPLDTHAAVMFYNNEILERANLTAEDLASANDMESWNNILEALLPVISQDEHVLDIANSGANTVQQFWSWYVLAVQDGGGYLEGDTVIMNDEPGVEALDILIDWKEKGYLKSGIDDGASYDIFKSGKAAINFTGVWATGNYETNPDLDFGVMPIPAINGQQKTWGDSHTFAIPSYVDGERQEAALYFADWINSHAVTWAKAGHVPAKKTVTESEEYLNLPYRSDYAKVVDQVVYYPSNEKLWSANDIAAKLINTAFIGDITSQEALDLAKEEIEAIME
jgi:multiple sugar transport system substrate-binding protein